MPPTTKPKQSDKTDNKTATQAAADAAVKAGEHASDWVARAMHERPAVDDEASGKMERVNKAFAGVAQVIANELPRSEEQRDALRRLNEVRMAATCFLANRGRR